MRPFPKNLLITALSLSATIACGGNGEPTQPGPEDPPDDSTPTTATSGTIVVDSFQSSALGISKRYLIYLPPSYATSKSKRYPVTYFLHGSTSGERSWVDDGHLDKTLDSLYKADKTEMIVVMPDGDNSFYHTWVNPPTYASCLERGRIDQEPASTYCVPNMRYDTYIATDLVAHIDGKYRTMAEKKHRGIAGLSMGGAGAVYLTLTRPTVFGAAASLSGGVLSLLNIGTPEAPVEATNLEQLQEYHGIFWGDFSMLQQFGTNLDDWRKYDPSSIAASIPASSIAPMWFIVGTYDVLSLPGNRTIDAVLTRRGIRHTYSEVQGGHTFEFWTAHAGEAAAWVAQQIKP